MTALGPPSWEHFRNSVHVLKLFILLWWPTDEEKLELNRLDSGMTKMVKFPCKTGKDGLHF